MKAPVEIQVRPVVMPHIEQAARAAQAALDDLPPPFECTPRQLRLRDRLGEILIHTARAHIEAWKIEARLAADRYLAEQAQITGGSLQ